jgi:hypothetical protein
VIERAREQRRPPRGANRTNRRADDTENTRRIGQLVADSRAMVTIQIAGGVLLAGVVLLLVWLAYKGLRWIVHKMIEVNTVL